MSSVQNSPSHSSPHSQPYPQPQPSSYPDPDEINLLEYIYVIVKNKWWIIGATVIGLIAGYGLALKKGPRFISEAVIAAKESESQKTPNLSSFGAFSGLVASQLNISANPGLDKIELILDSRKFNAELIEKYDLLPIIYKETMPKVYPKLYDTLKNEWKTDFKKPEMLGMGGMIKGQFLKKETKAGLMTIKIESKDSTFSDTLLAKYLEYLNSYIQDNVQSDAKENVSYLEKQLVTIADPLLREKIQGLIANEFEKAMLVSKEAFRVVDPPFKYAQFKQKKLFPMVFGAGLFFMTMMLVVFGHAFASGQKTDEDRELIKKIKKSLL
ncbi:MAG TPA: Wzz/FepE/Etk N-terminal domain-containing protein [Chitinispirillaceae bacterium]|nr:Wzz/FepE/Etk N-terminal domain-containing protein [Chitinispirillaceae bacterium]